MPVQIVFVDDSKSILKTIEILLKNRVQNGEIAIRTFSKSADFLDAIESKSLKFSVLFLDINMPVLSGYDVLKKLREMETYKDIPIIALTTENMPEALKKGKDFGFNDWIVKINAPITLLKSINTVIDNYAPKKKIEDKSIRGKLDTESAIKQMRQMFITIEELNKKLFVAEENKSRFLSLIRNEFNNPLMTVTMLMKDIIEDQGKTKEEIVESLSLIFADILTLNSQLSNILAASEIESAAGMSNNLTNFSMKDMLDDIIDTQRFIHKGKHIDVQMSVFFPELIYKDRDKFFLILRNLIENAFEFSPEGSRVIVKGCIEDENIIFHVHNFGNQIKERGRMHDAFYHERSDFSRIHHGLGLGLAIVKHFTTFLGGEVQYCVEEDYNIFKASLPLDPDAVCLEVRNEALLVFEDVEDDMGIKF